MTARWSSYAPSKWLVGGTYENANCDKIASGFEFRLRALN